MAHPSHWGFDPKYPDNRLPYADTVEYAIVNDPAAITALMRTGQADYMGFALNSHLTSVDAGVNLQKTNPDLMLHPFAYRSETAMFWNVQQAPFDDIRVRRAIVMAIDFDAIAENYMQGWGDAIPSGPIGPAVLGYALRFEEWPDEVKRYYRYDPEAAEKLLDEAGYPRGADDVRFKTRYGHYEFFDLGYYQIAMELAGGGADAGGVLPEPGGRRAARPARPAPARRRRRGGRRRRRPRRRARHQGPPAARTIPLSN